MFRTMKNKSQKIKVYGWGVTKYGWEYYFMDNKHNSDIRMALVCGFENEIGSVSVNEIKEFLLTYAKGDDLNDIEPAPEWVWE